MEELIVLAAKGISIQQDFTHYQNVIPVQLVFRWPTGLQYKSAP